MLWHEQSWPQIQSVDKNIPVVVPLGSLEQHGKHLPLFVDSIQVESVFTVTPGGGTITLPTVITGAASPSVDIATNEIGGATGNYYVGAPSGTSIRSSATVYRATCELGGSPCRAGVLAMPAASRSPIATLRMILPPKMENPFHEPAKSVGK